MIPAPFDYLRPATLDEALAALAANADAKLLAGGHSLIPAMKLRLAQPPLLIDISRIPGLGDIREENGALVVGALATHAAIEASSLLKDRCPLLPAVAAQIGDVQVRNRGTLGGSLAHADPAADWPAALLALDAELEVRGPIKQRTIKAASFFVDIMETALKPGEVLCAIRFPATGKGVAYVKSAQKASGFALAGVAVVIENGAAKARIAVTGVTPKPYRARRAESVLAKQGVTPDSILKAAAKVATNIEPLGDIHASPEYRANLARVNARRALELALGRI